MRYPRLETGGPHKARNARAMRAKVNLKIGKPPSVGARELCKSDDGKESSWPFSLGEGSRSAGSVNQDSEAVRPIFFFQLLLPTAPTALWRPVELA